MGRNEAASAGFQHKSPGLQTAGLQLKGLWGTWPQEEQIQGQKQVLYSESPSGEVIRAVVTASERPGKGSPGLADPLDVNVLL